MKFHRTMKVFPNDFEVQRQYAVRFSPIWTFIRHTILTDSLLCRNGALHNTAITGLYLVVLMTSDSRL